MAIEGVANAEDKPLRFSKACWSMVQGNAVVAKQPLGYERLLSDAVKTIFQK
jgi:hypothetical protein